MNDNQKSLILGLLALKTPLGWISLIIVLIVAVICFFLVIVTSFLGVAGFEVEDTESGTGQACLYVFNEKDYLQKLNEAYGVSKKTGNLLLDVAVEKKVDASVLYAMLKVEGQTVDKSTLEKYGDNIYTKYISKMTFTPQAIFEDNAPTVTTTSENEKGEKVTSTSKDQSYISSALEIVNTLQETLICNEDPNAIEGSISKQVYGDGVFSPPLLGNLRLTSPYGYRVHPRSGISHFHRGVDFGCPNGVPILSVLPGIVHTSKYHHSWGNYVLVNHENGIYTLYAHMNVLAVKTGERITAGTTLGTCGSTGDSTGPHLHFEVQLGSPYGTLTNPLTYFNF